jgi:hypothetical protein
MEEKQASIPHGVQKGMCIWKVARVFTSSLHKDEKVNERQGSHFWILYQQIMCLFAIFISVLSSVNTPDVMMLLRIDHCNEPYELHRYAFPSQ